MPFTDDGNLFIQTAQQQANLGPVWLYRKWRKRDIWYGSYMFPTLVLSHEYRTPDGELRYVIPKEDGSMEYPPSMLQALQQLGVTVELDFAAKSV